MFHPLLPQHVVLVLGNALFAVEVIGDFACAHVSFGTLEISIGDRPQQQMERWQNGIG